MNHKPQTAKEKQPKQTATLITLGKQIGKPRITGIIGAGGCGINILKYLMRTISPHEGRHMLFFGFNTETQQMEALVQLTDESGRKLAEGNKGDQNLAEWLGTLNEKKNPQLTLMQIGDGDGAGGDPKVARRLVKNKYTKQLFEKWIGRCDHIILIGGLGKGTGGGTLPVLQQMAKRLKKDPLTIAVLPDSSYADIMTDALKTLDELYRHGTTWAIYNDSAPESFKNGNYAAMFEEINNRTIIPVLIALEEIMHISGGLVNTDFADWRTTIRAGNAPIIYYRECRDDETVEVFAEELMVNNVYQKTDHLPSTKRITLWCHGDWTKTQETQILDAIKKGIQPDGMPMSIKIVPGIHPGNDRKKWAAIYCAAQIDILAQSEKSRKTPVEAKLSVATLPPSQPNPKKPDASRPALIYVALKPGQGNEEVYVSRELHDEFAAALSGKNFGQRCLEDLLLRIKSELGLEVYHPVFKNHVNGNGNGNQLAHAVK